MTEFDELKIFYEKLCDSIRKYKKKPLKEQSPLEIFIETTLPNVYEILKKSSIPLYEFKEEEKIKELIEKKLIIESENPDEYVISPHGIWTYEKNHSEKDILITHLNFLKNRFYSKLYKGKKTKLLRREKIVLFALIATRAFSRESCMDLSDERNLFSYWREILDASRDWLLNFGIIEEKENDKFWSDPEADDQTRTRYLMSRINKLTEKTKGFYHKPGGRIYYLSLSSERNAIKAQISLLLTKIFDNIELDIIIKQEIIDFFSKINFNYSNYIFGAEQEFSNSDFDDFLEDLILFF